MPMTPFSGVRISWLILARKSVLARLAASAAALASTSARSAIAQPLGAPFQGQVVAVGVAIAVGEAHHRVVVLAVLDLDHAAQGAGHVLGMHEAQQLLALHVLGTVAHLALPRAAGLQHVPLDVADDQQVQRHVEEGADVFGERRVSGRLGHRDRNPC
jgi:hypothetical protein